MTRMSQSQAGINSLSSSTSARQRTRAQTAAFLLGIRPSLPDANDEDFSRVNAVRHFYQGITNRSDPVEKVTAQQYQAPELEKVEFRVPLHTLDRLQSITYVDRLHSELDARRDIFDSIKATMDVPELYEHLGWRLSTARRTDPPHRLLTVHDIDSAFKAVREEESSSGRKKKKVVIEILNTIRVVFDTFKWFAGHDRLDFAGACAERKINTMKDGHIIFCKRAETPITFTVHKRVRQYAAQPNTPHYPLCAQDLQEWAKHLHHTQDPDNACVTLPDTLHFDEIRKTRKERSASSLQRVPTEVISRIRIHNHIHLSSAVNDMISRDGTFTRQQGLPITPPPPLKRTYALYLESDDESSDDEPPQDIEDVLTSAHSRYPTMNFPQYIGKLKDRGVLYLPTAAFFTTGFYKEQIGMSDGAACTFWNWVSKAYAKAERAKGRRKSKGKKKARSRHGDSEDQEDIPPIN
ncbi:hypothetical protein EV424DRAFT_1539002 [Suillus variegatus]|nr:hypothetical protein EV424DRAFT_1539002 [Suillus variegatus]